MRALKKFRVLVPSSWKITTIYLSFTILKLILSRRKHTFVKYNLVTVLLWYCFNLFCFSFLSDDNVIGMQLVPAMFLRIMIFDYFLKWHYAQYSLQILGCTCSTLQKTAINNDKIQIKYNVIF